MSDTAEHIPEADCAHGCIHPRYNYDLIGHQVAEQRFLHAFASARLHHAWLISGPKGYGKATLAYRMIRHVLGARQQMTDSLKFSESDPVVRRLQSLGHGNFLLLRRPFDTKLKKFKTEIPVETMRQMHTFFAHKPAEPGWRCCLIDSADELTHNAENSVLKILEEPPDKALIILLSSTPGRLLPTIRSRCHHIPLQPVNSELMLPWLQNKFPEASENLLLQAVQLSRGGPGQSITLVQNADMVIAPLLRFLENLKTKNSVTDYELASQLAHPKVEKSRHLFWDALQNMIESQTKYMFSGQWHSVFQPLAIQKTPRRWLEVWQRIRFLQTREAALNMDKKATMLDIFTDIRRM